MPVSRVFPAWRGVAASNGVRGGGGWGPAWTWGRCLQWEPTGLDSPVWLVLCRGGHDRLREVCRRGSGAIKLSTEMLRMRLPELFEVHQVPKAFHEESIIGGYRHPQSSARDCLLSSFQLNNETLNIWTHFLPTWYFLWRFSVLCSTLNFLSDSYTWPLLVYMVVITIYPFTSSCAHTFSTMSPESRHICYFFDYGALSLFSLGCAIAYSAYIMPSCWVNSWLHHYFVPIAIGNSLLCTSLSCYSRFLELQFPQRSKVLRTSAFVIPFIFDTIPLCCRLLLCCGRSCGPADLCLLAHLLLAFLTCFLFTSHLPERLAPGRFDYFGHSHQLFHVSAVVGTYYQLEGVLADMASRRAWLLAHAAPPSLLGTMGALLLSLLLNLGIIAIFSAPLLWNMRQHDTHTPAERKEQ